MADSNVAQAAAGAQGLLQQITKVFSGSVGVPNGYLQFPKDLTNRNDITQYTYFAPYDKFNSYNSIVSTEKPLGQLYLPLPKELNVSYKTNWETKDMGAAGAGNLADAGANAIAQEVLNRDTILSNWAKIATKTTPNPYKQVMWKGPEFRTFTFSFELVPSNGEESDSLNQIIWVFKKYMHTPSGFSEATLNQPPLWNVKFVDAKSKGNLGSTLANQNGQKATNPGNPYLFQLKDCAMTSFDVDYTIKGNAFHMKDLKDGRGFHAPNGVKITIGLTETSILTQWDYGKDSTGAYDPNNATY